MLLEVEVAYEGRQWGLLALTVIQVCLHRVIQCGLLCLIWRGMTIDVANQEGRTLVEVPGNEVGTVGRHRCAKIDSANSSASVEVADQVLAVVRECRHSECQPLLGGEPLPERYVMDVEFLHGQQIKGERRNEIPTPLHGGNVHAGQTD